MAPLLTAVARLFEGRTPAAPQLKQSRTGPLVALHTQGQPVWTPRDYAALAREGFAKNAVVYRCVRMISEAAASVPLVLFEGARQRDEHDLLALLRQPNALDCAPDLFEAWYEHNRDDVDRARGALSEILDGDELSLSRLTVSVTYVRDLVPG